MTQRTSLPTTTHQEEHEMTTTRLEKVLKGQRIARPQWDDFRTVAAHDPNGFLHCIRVQFTDGSSMTALPSTPVEVLS